MSTPFTVEKPLRLECAAATLDVSIKTMRRLIQNHDISAFKIGGRWFLRASEIEAFIQRQLAKTGGNSSC